LRAHVGLSCAPITRPSTAVSITLLDRSISYASLIVIGFVIFVFTHVHVPKARRIATQG